MLLMTVAVTSTRHVIYRMVCTTSTWTHQRRTYASCSHWRPGGRRERLERRGRGERRAPHARCPTYAPAGRACCRRRPRRTYRRCPPRRPPEARPSPSTPTTRFTSDAPRAPRAPPPTRCPPSYSVSVPVTADGGLRTADSCALLYTDC